MRDQDTLIDDPAISLASELSYTAAQHGYPTLSRSQTDQPVPVVLGGMFWYRAFPADVERGDGAAGLG